MKKITIITMQLKTPGGIERFVSTLADMFSSDFKVEIVANYGRPEEKLTFPLSEKVKTTFLTPTQPKEISMKKLITGFKWHKIPNELRRRQKIDETREKAFKSFLKDLDTDYIITDRALYNHLVQKYYRGNAVKIATDHNFHQNKSQYIDELMDSIEGFDYLVVATDELKDFYSTKTDVKCLKINNPLDTIPSKKSDLSSKNLISVGRFVPEKDFETLIDVMKLVHEKDENIHLTIIGDGITYPRVKTKVEKLGLEAVVSLPGFLSQAEIKQYYYDSSLFVLTSKTEAFGLVLTEAMSYGLPCIAFDRASGARAQITKHTGILIEDADVEKMANRIIKLLKDHELLKTYQNFINQAIVNYDKKQIQKDWAKIVL